MSTTTAQPDATRALPGNYLLAFPTLTFLVLGYFAEKRDEAGYGYRVREWLVKRGTPVTFASVYRVVKKLRKKEMLEQLASPDEKGRTFVRITDKGRAQFKRLAATAEMIIPTLLKAIKMANATRTSQ